MYWQKEKQGVKLTEIEIKEQNLHLINKIYTLGYFAYRYKEPNKAWAAWATDARDSELGKSFGGSGKSIFFESLKFINEVFKIDGKKRDLTEDKFLFDGVNYQTFTIFIDDILRNIDFPFFFSKITGDLTINGKNVSPFTILFETSPKICFTSNFPLKNVDNSTKRRLLISLFSDYYHEKDLQGIYDSTFTPNMEFGKNLFKDFSDAEWNKFYNFYASAIQSFMKFEKIDPPMENFAKRSLKEGIGEQLFEWFTDYFENESKLNNEIERKQLAAEIKTDIAYAKNLTPQKIKTKLVDFCSYKGWEFNPKEYLTNGKQISKGGIEYFYIRTFDKTDPENTTDPDEMPF